MLATTRDELSKPQLSDPLELGRGTLLANRLARSALSESLGDQHNNPSDELVRLHRRWATAGGHGLIITGNVMVDRRHLGEPGNVVVEDERALGTLRRWASAAKAGGAKVWMQINHPGRQALPLLTGNRPVAPSAIRPEIPGAAVPRALEHHEIEEIVRRFAVTARVAKRAGFDGVQLHGAHGYLISQFLSPLSNRRDDSWGGDSSRRLTFVLKVMEATRAAVGQDFSIGIKLNSADFQRGGICEADSMATIDALAEAGIDLVEVSGGTYSSTAMLGIGKPMRESTRSREAYFQSYAEKVRRRTPGLPLMLTGGFRTIAGMQMALDDGACDLVGVARATCSDPDISAKLLAGTQLSAPVQTINAGARWLFQPFIALDALDSAINMSWHTDQMHRMGAGKEPDPNRSWQRTLARMIRRNGWAALRRKRT